MSRPYGSEKIDPKIHRNFLGARIMRKIITTAALLIALSATNVFAECYMVKSSGGYETLGRYPVSVAHKACLNTYKRTYRKNKSLGDSNLYLECGGPRRRIAFVRNRRLNVLRVLVEGCSAPS